MPGLAPLQLWVIFTLFN